MAFVNSSRTTLKSAVWKGGNKAYADLLDELTSLQQELTALEKSLAPMLQQVDARHRSSAANLIHYLALRRRDMRPLQEKLATAGLSSLGRAESHVLTNLHAIIVLLQRALGKEIQQIPSSIVGASMVGSKILQNNTDKLLGKLPPDKQGRIMVTLPGEAADDYMLIKEMLMQGMNCARINCAHDDAAVWMRMIKQIKGARRESMLPCRILMDVGGPKLRTGQIAAGPAVLKWQPQRDVYGRVTGPARIWIYPEADASTCPPSAHACLPIKGNWVTRISVGDKLEFTDARGALRSTASCGKGRGGLLGRVKTNGIRHAGPQTLLIASPRFRPCTPQRLYLRNRCSPHEA